MFTVTQRVHNATGQSVALYPYYRVNRGYTPEETGGMLVHEGPIAVIDDRLNEGSYKSVRNDGVPPENVAWSHQGTGGWAGITDKYWLMAIVPDQTASVVGTYAWQAAQGQYQVALPPPLRCRLVWGRVPPRRPMCLLVPRKCGC